MFNIQITEEMTAARISFSRKHDRHKPMRKTDVPIKMIQLRSVSMPVMVRLLKKMINF